MKNPRHPKQKITSEGIGLYVNQCVNPEQRTATLEAILAIIKDVNDPAVLIKALDVLDHATQSRPIAVENCEFTINGHA